MRYHYTRREGWDTYKVKRERERETEREMGRGRAPCCDKSKVKKGPWSPAEDLRLITFIQKNGHGNWRALPKQAGLLRCGKSCRLRWINYLRPGVKRGNFSPEEEDTIIKLHQSMGNKWSKIASLLPGRTDNEIKNVWNTHLKKRVVVIKDGINHQTKDSTANSSLSPSSSSTSFMSSSYDHDHIIGDVAYEGCEVQVFDEKQDYPKVVLQSSPSHQPNQLPSTSSSSSSSSSYQSHFSDSGQADVPLPKQEMGPFFDFGGPCEVHDDDDDQMMNNKGFSDDQTVEIPLESDVDFWDMLDNLDLFHESNEADQLQGLEAAQCSNLRESECRKWLRCLESELGLETTSSNGDNDNPPENDVSACDMMILSPEIEQGLPYFQTWPSSPHNFSV